MATAVEDVAQEVLDAADTALEEASDAVDSARTFDFAAASVGIGAGVAIGATGAYFFLKKRLTLKYEQIADEEITGMREHYNARVRALENEREKEKLGEVQEEIKTRQEANDGEGQTPYHTFYQGGSEPDKTPQGETIEYVEATPQGIAEAASVTQNVFNNGDDPEIVIEEAWNYEEEVKARSPEIPYVIHRDEYNDETPDGFDQYTLTYFEGDDVLCRDDDRVIEDQDSVVGLGNLTKFGHGSGDPNIVYIRNEELKVDLEVVHSDGKYATEVHGFQEDELQHSSMRRRSPRRSEYDADNR